MSPKTRIGWKGRGLGSRGCEVLSSVTRYPLGLEAEENQGRVNGVVVDPVCPPENASPGIEYWEVSGDVGMVHDEGEADSNGGGRG